MSQHKSKDARIVLQPIDADAFRQENKLVQELCCQKCNLKKFHTHRLCIFLHSDKFLLLLAILFSVVLG